MIATAAAELPGYLTWLIPVIVIGVIVQFLWGTIVSVALYRMAKSDRITEGQAKKLHELATQLVDEKFRAMTHSINNHVEGFTKTLDSLTAHLRLREEDLEALDDEGHRLEIKMLTEIGELKTFVVQNAASKEDLRDHQTSMSRTVEKISQHLSEQDQKLARIEGRCG